MTSLSFLPEDTLNPWLQIERHQRIRSYCANAQYDLSLRWALMSTCNFNWIPVLIFFFFWNRERAPADQGYIRHYRGCKSTPLLFCRQLYRQTVDTEMTNWANNIRNKTRQVRKHLYGDENAFITWNTSG